MTASLLRSAVGQYSLLVAGTGFKDYKADGITLGGGYAPFITILSQGAHHYVDPTPYNHYSLLGTFEQLWGLGCLNEACKLGPDGLMTKFFQ